MNAAFFDAVRSTLFGGTLTQDQVDALKEIGKAWRKYGDDFSYGNLRLAYIFATAYHETGAFKWMREIWGPTAAQKRYEGRTDLGNTKPGDGKRFMGRGFVMITGRANYTDWAQRLGMDIVANPDLVERPDIAARILVEGMTKGTFTGKNLLDYINSDMRDFRNARRVVNGTDRANRIAGYAEKFLAALGEDWTASPTQPPKPAPRPEVPETDKPASGKRAIGWAAIGGAIAAILFAIFNMGPF